MDKKEQILKLVAEYISEKHSTKQWKSTENWVQYAGPLFSSDEFVAAVDTLLDEWLVLGEDAIKFEKTFPPHLGKKFGVVVNSGSSANLIMMETAKKYFRLENGTRVITPVAGFPTTLNAILQCGLLPSFVDIEIETLNLNLTQVEEAAKQGAKVLMFAHVLGNPPNMDKVMEIVKKYNLILLEDCCDALGTTYNNLPVGHHGAIATCSFYPAHHMTMGEGGFVACENEEMEKIARSFREWGRGCYCVGKRANLSSKGMCGCRFNKWLPSFKEEIFDHKYVYDNIGYNLKPIELQCSIGLKQMEKLPLIHSRRKENYARLYEIFKKYEKFFHLPLATPNSDPSWFAFPLTIKNNSPFKRSTFTKYLEDNRIQTRNYFGGKFLAQPAYNDICWWNVEHNYKDSNGNNNYKVSFPIATKVTLDTFFLGTSPVITLEQLNYVENVINTWFTIK